MWSIREGILNSKFSCFVYYHTILSLVAFIKKINVRKYAIFYKIISGILIYILSVDNAGILTY